MSKQGDLRRRSRRLKEKWPNYGPLLDFYLDVRDAQEASRATLCLKHLRQDPVGNARFEQRGPEQDIRDIKIDLKASRRLFMGLCWIGSTANPHFAQQVESITSSISNGSFDLDAVIEDWSKTQQIEELAADKGLDAQVLSFLIANCVRPSIEVARDQRLTDMELETWKGNKCPVCSSFPGLNALKGDPLLRHSVCFKCGCEWQVDRLACAFCGEKDKDKRSYFHAEGQDAHRIDLCDGCHHYIKTIDLSKIDVPDLFLEDLATQHLDVIAVEKGYSRCVPNAWIS